VDGPEDLIVLTGPTCSGKTGLALLLAQRFPIEVVSADSMQVYRYMDIATAKPSPAERAALPHHIIDVVNPDEDFHAAMFTAMAEDRIGQIRARGRIPVVVGGTGLYIKALVYGLAPAPARSERVRKALRTVMKTRGTAYLERMLRRLDPGAAALVRKNDGVRMVRALEVILMSGRRVSDIYAGHGFRQKRYDVRTACILPDRDRLFGDIDRRTLKMLEDGLFDETRRLLDKGYGPDLRSMQTLAYRHAVAHLRGECGAQECIRLIQRDTRRFAKRQITWVKAQQDHVFFASADTARRTVSQWLQEEARGPG